MAACKYWIASNFNLTVRPFLRILQKAQICLVTVNKIVSLLNPFGIYLFLLILKALEQG